MKKIIKPIVTLLISITFPLIANYKWEYTEYIEDNTSYHKSFITNEKNSILGIQCIKKEKSNNLLIVLVQNEFDFIKKNEMASIVVNKEKYDVIFDNYKNNGNVLMIDIAKINRVLIEELLWDAYFSKNIKINFENISFEFKTKQSSKTLNKMLDDCLI